MMFQNRSYKLSSKKEVVSEALLSTNGCGGDDITFGPNMSKESSKH
jgi:hypothetical protein